MRAGRLRHRLAIYRPTKSAGVSGAETLNLIGSFPAEIAPISGKEYVALGGTTDSVTHKITMRYLHNITTACVGYYAGRRFDFKQVISPDERRRELQIMAVET